MNSRFSDLCDPHDRCGHIERLALGQVWSAVVSRSSARSRKVSISHSACERCEEMLRAELELVPAGISRVAGVDEAGRGPLAGPVVAAAVVLPRNLRAVLPGPLSGIDDSKRLSPSARESLFLAVVGAADAVSIGIATSLEIDRSNILRATHLAMRRAVQGLAPAPDLALIDGSSDPGLSCPAQCIVRGDSQVLSISAASVVAKVARDTIMESIHALFPHYGFDANKGYPTSLHYRALALNGPCPVHRRSYRLFARQ